MRLGIETLPKTFHLRSVWFLAGALLVGALGLRLLIDRPGLRVDYFATDTDWQGSPIYSDVGPPQVQGCGEVGGILVSKEIFSLRWRGWLWIEESGEYRFRLKADEWAYLRLDDEVVVPGDRARPRKVSSAPRRLEQGLHSIEVGLVQTGGNCRLELRWAAAGRGGRRLSGDVLWADSPTGLERRLRGVTASRSLLERKILGALFVLVGLLLLGPALRPLESGLQRLGDSVQRRLANPVKRRALQAAFLLSLFVLTFFLSRPFTTPTWSGDDVRYVDAAFFNKRLAWHLTRYTHIYLVKAAIWLEGGDAFAGSRTYWSFMAAVTVVSLAIGARSLGPGLQLRTLSISLFLLLSQWTLLHSIGAAYADYTATMLVVLAVAVYLQGFLRKPRGEIEWPALLLGVLTALAVRSKETGLILLWLPVLFLWVEGRVDWRRFSHRLGLWLVGALLGGLLLMSLDAWLLGDFWFSLRRSTWADFLQFKVAADARQDWSRWVWPQVVWSGHPKGSPVSYGMRRLGGLALLAALVAAVSKRRMELRLLHLMPVVYVVMLIGVHTPIFGVRYLYPILPVASLLGAAMFAYVGVEELKWRQLLSPRVLVPAFLAVMAILLIAVPHHTGELDAGKRFATGMAVFLAILLVAGVALAVVGSRMSAIVLAVCLLGYFAPSFEVTRLSIVRQLSLQRGQLILYPWREFEAELTALRPKTVVVAPRLYHKYQMAGTWITGTRIARLYFKRPRMRVTFEQQLPANFTAALGSRRDWDRWQDDVPDLEGEAIFDATGQVALVRRGRKARR